jgi:hypothetical protein
MLEIGKLEVEKKPSGESQVRTILRNVISVANSVLYSTNKSEFRKVDFAVAEAEKRLAERVLDTLDLK